MLMTLIHRRPWLTWPLLLVSAVLLIGGIALMLR